nr:PREDICTED: UDP-glucuronosyltransferase 1-6-like [Lepisosteus oculatus]
MKDGLCIFLFWRIRLRQFSASDSMALAQALRQHFAIGLLAGLCVFLLDSVQGGKLLAVPVDGSHWISMKPVLIELGKRGHTVVVAIPEVSMQMGPSSHYTTKTFPVPYTKEKIREMNQLQRKVFEDVSTLGQIRFILGFVHFFQNFSRSTCESFFYNQELMQDLKEQEFDAVLTDPVLPCGVIVAEYLSVPSIYMLRGIPCSLDFRATQCPRPPSFVPTFFTKFSDQMTFTQRIVNFLINLLEPLLCKFLFSAYDDMASSLLQRDVTVEEIMSRASVWLMRFEFTFEYPRPLMPNMVLIGGINCAQRKALSLVSLAFYSKW